MPLYEYLCLECGTKFEALISFKNTEEKMPCTHCKGTQTTRILSVFNAHSGGKAITGSTSGSSCSGCSGGNCSACGH